MSQSPAMTSTPQTQREFWNGAAGERWVAHQAQIDRSMAAITALWLDSIPAGDRRVLDVGCGCGTTTRLLRARGAYVLGVDVSAPMLAVARRDGGDYVEADAASHPFAPFDRIVSRFGVMFFDDPVAAFTNLRAASARLAFVCWRAVGDNPWATLPLAAAGELVPAPPSSDPHAPGPFAFADRDHLRDVLARAGFANVAIERRDSALCFGATLDDGVAHALAIGPLARAVVGVDDDTRARVAERVRRALDRHGLELAASVWLVTA